MKFTIIVPCYNAEKTVNKTLDSLLGQRIGRENLEIILVDDASTDQTVSILKGYEEKYPDNIAVVLCDENGRQGTARNIGLSYATGDYVNFVDSDDEIHPDMYSIFTEILTNEPDTEIISFDFFHDPEGLNKDIHITGDDYESYDISEEKARREILFRDDIINNSCTRKLYKRELLVKSGVRFAEGVFYEEPLFTYPLKFFADHIISTSLPLYYYHLNAEGTINSKLKDPITIGDHLSVQAELIDFMKKQGYYEQYKDEIELHFLHCFVYETFCFMQGRGMTMPTGLFRSIADIVEKTVPGWERNPYLKSIPKEEQDIIGLLRVTR